MPPKKKKGKGKGKDGDELENKFKKATHEIESMRDELVFRRELVRRAQSVSALSRNKTMDLEIQIDEIRTDAKANNSELIRQYRAIESEMNVKVASLQVEFERTKQKLAETETKLKDKCKELDDLKTEKDQKIADLEQHIWNIERQHLNILTSAFDTLAGKVRDAHDRWVSEAVSIQSDHKHKLLELGLKPLEF